MERIYIAFAIDAGKRTPEEKIRKYEVTKLRYNNPTLTYEEYAKFQMGFKDFDYFAIADPMGYYTTKKLAEEAVQNNTCDINEAGCYPYAAVLPLPTDCMYANSYAEDNDVLIYKYNFESGMYGPLPIRGNEDLIDRILQEVTGLIHMTSERRTNGKKEEG